MHGSIVVIRVLAIFVLATSSNIATAAQETATDGSAPDSAPLDSAIPKEVAVTPEAQDKDIAARLTGILAATGWYVAPKVSVDEGVVFLSGQAHSQQHKEWAGKLAGRTSNVVAVVNRMELVERSIWDLSPAWREVQALAAQGYRTLPLLLLGLVMLLLSWLAAGWSASGAATLLRRRLKNDLLRHVASRAVAIPVFLIGLYLILKVSGLTRLAVTVIGGTGLVGVVIGFAFRDIAENFLASILISMQHPFAQGDLIEIAGAKGYVREVNTRSTLLMTMDGNHVQIPNATIYKETIVNFTANPNMRLHFIVGIGYESSISEAQTIAMAVLRDHPAVLSNPESLVLVDSLGAATVNLTLLFWVDTSKHSEFKVRSAVIRLTKQAFAQADISMPDEAREVVFPDGVPVHLSESAEVLPRPQPSEGAEETEADVHGAEGDLVSEASEICEQADRARKPEGGQNLL